MIPLRDDVPTRLRPVVVLGLIAANLAVYAYQLSLQMAGGEGAVDGFVRAWALVPRDFLRGIADPQATERWVGFTAFSSMFLHAGLLHVAGNLLYLGIFGNNVEDLLGHGRFLLFYLVCGLTAAAAHVASTPDSFTPTLGASGAVSGVLGAYLVSYPTGRVRTLLPLGFVWTTVTLPALAFLGVWFAIQLVAGLGSVGAEGAGVAWWAHIGGFAAGVLLVRPLRLHAPLRARTRV